MTKRKEDALFLIILAASIYIFGINTGVYVDDVYIYLRVVKNIVNGIGPVINPGDTHLAVTSPLWTYTLVCFSYVSGGLGLVKLSKLIYILCLIPASYFTRRLALPYAGIFSIFSPLVIFFNNLTPAYVGGEAALAYLTLTGVLWSFLVKKDHIFTGIFLALAYLTRGELILLLPVIIVYYAFERGRNKMQLKDAALDMLRLFVPFLALTLSWHAYYFIRFESLFPKTFSAKIIQGKSGMWPLYSKSVFAHIDYITVDGRIFLLFFTVFGVYYLRALSALAASFTFLHYLTYSMLSIPYYHWYFYDIDLLLSIWTVFGAAGFFDIFKKGLARFSFGRAKEGAFDKSLTAVSFLALIAVSAFATELYRARYFLDLGAILTNNQTDETTSASQRAGSIALGAALTNNQTDERLRNYVKAAKWLNGRMDNSDTVLVAEVGIISYFLEKGFIRDVNGIASPDVTLENIYNYPYFINRYKPRYLIVPAGDTQEAYRLSMGVNSYFFRKVFVAEPSAKWFKVAIFDSSPVTP